MLKNDHAELWIGSFFSEIAPREGDDRGDGGVLQAVLKDFIADEAGAS